MPGDPTANTGACRKEQFHHYAALAGLGRNDPVRGRNPTEERRRRIEGDRAPLLEGDQAEDGHNALADLEVVEVLDELPGTSPAQVVDPVVAVGSGAELTDPAEHERRRSVDIHGPEDDVRIAHEPIAGISLLALA